MNILAAISTQFGRKITGQRSTLEIIAHLKHILLFIKLSGFAKVTLMIIEIQISARRPMPCD